MSLLFRARATSFLVGLGLGSGFALLQLRTDVQESHRALAEQVSTADATTNARLTALEAAVARLQQ